MANAAYVILLAFITINIIIQTILILTSVCIKNIGFGIVFTMNLVVSTIALYSIGVN